MQTDNRHRKRIKGKKRDAVGLLVLLLLAFLTLYVLACQGRNQLPFFGKYALVRVATGSMEPNIPTGTYILVEKVSAEGARALPVGTVIVFNSRDPSIYGKLNTHRIVAVNGDGTYTTKGDKWESEDAYSVYSEDIQGIYRSNVGWLTRAVSYVTGHPAAMFAILIPLILIYVLLSVVNDTATRKKTDPDALVQAEVEKLRAAAAADRALQERIDAEVRRLTEEAARREAERAGEKTAADPGEKPEDPTPH